MDDEVEMTLEEAEEIIMQWQAGLYILPSKIAMALLFMEARNES